MLVIIYTVNCRVCGARFPGFYGGCRNRGKSTIKCWSANDQIWNIQLYKRTKGKRCAVVGSKVGSGHCVSCCQPFFKIADTCSLFASNPWKFSFAFVYDVQAVSGGKPCDKIRTIVYRSDTKKGREELGSLERFSMYSKTFLKGIIHFWENPPYNFSPLQNIIFLSGDFDNFCLVLSFF